MAKCPKEMTVRINLTRIVILIAIKLIDYFNILPAIFAAPHCYIHEVKNMLNFYLCILRQLFENEQRISNLIYTIATVYFHGHTSEGSR